MYKIENAFSVREVVNFLNKMKLKPANIIKIFEKDNTWKIVYYNE